MASKNQKVILGAAGVAVAAAAAAAAGAVLSNPELKKALNKRATEALKTVSKLALEAEKQADKGLKLLQSKTEKFVKEQEKADKPKSKKKAG